MASDLVGYQALPCADVSSCWLTHPGHEVADYRTPGGPESGTGSLVSEVKLQKTPELLSTHWWFNLDPRVSARWTYWQTEPGLRFDCKALGSLVSDLVVGAGELSLDTIEYEAWGVPELVLAC